MEPVILLLALSAWSWSQTEAFCTESITNSYSHYGTITCLTISQSGLDFTDLNNMHLETNVRTFKIVESNITQLPPLFLSNLPKIQNLDKLILQNIHIKTIESRTFEKLSTLSNLYLDRNEIVALRNESFEGLKNLRNLYLNDNQISVIDRNGFKGMPQLDGLYLQNNHLENIPVGAFQSLSSLRVLNLSHNAIEQFQYGTFGNSTNLRELYLQHNKLYSIFQLNHLPQLHTLNVDYNNILQFNVADINTNLASLKEISFNHNPWSCKNLLQAYNRLRGAVAHGNSFDVENIKGIPCNDSQSIGNEIAGKDGSFGHPDNDEKSSKFYDVDFFQTKFYKYFQKDYAESNFFSYLRNYKISIVNGVGQNNTNGTGSTSTSEAAKLTSLAVQPESGIYGVAVLMTILLAIVVIFQGFNVYKKVTKHSFASKQLAVSMQEGLMSDIEQV